MTTRKLTLAVLFASAILGGCTCHSTGSTEIGVLTRKVSMFGILGEKGVQQKTYESGITSFFIPFTTDWNTYDISIQNLAMIAGGGNDDAIRFKTTDGNDVHVDVTVVWQINAAKAAHTLQHVGEDTDMVRRKLVRPACRSIVRDVLNELQSEDFYIAEKRFQKANEARDRLAKMLEPEGIVVTQVILGEHHFHPEYEQVIRDKKLAEQNSERLRSEAKAAAEQAKSKLEKAKGEVNQQLAEAAGYLDQVKLGADAQFFQSQKRAEAILAERKANAQAIQKRNEALAGSGGKTMVKLKIAEALAGKQILFVPAGQGGANLQTLNLNALIKAYAPEASQPEPPEATQDTSQ
jgi:regulator of protease activity HflC (stomatin/prohibitin superfamily)